MISMKDNGSDDAAERSHLNTGTVITNQPIANKQMIRDEVDERMDHMSRHSESVSEMSGSESGAASSADIGVSDGPMGASHELTKLEDSSVTDGRRTKGQSEDDLSSKLDRV